MVGVYYEVYVVKSCAFILWYMLEPRSCVLWSTPVYYCTPSSVTHHPCLALVQWSTLLKSSTGHSKQFKTLNDTVAWNPMHTVEQKHLVNSGLCIFSHVASAYRFVFKYFPGWCGLCLTKPLFTGKYAFWHQIWHYWDKSLELWNSWSEHSLIVSPSK